MRPEVRQPYKMFAGGRDLFLRAAIVFGAALVGTTEALSALGLLRQGPVLACWCVGILACAAYAWRRRGRTTRLRQAPDLFQWCCAAGVGLVFVLTAVAAWFSPPNSADAMAYHLPRVIYWAEQGSVRFFPTQYLNQIMLQPMAEYFMLHTYLLTGGDWLINFGQWLAAGGAVLGTSAVAAELGAGRRGQTIAAVFCATIPSGVLASSGAKNDYVLAFWLVAAVYFGLRFARSVDAADGLFLGMAGGLALFTKATGYLFLPWLLVPCVYVLLAARPRRWRKALPGVALGLVAGLAVNLPQFVRNVRFAGSPLGADSAQGDGVYRWRNERFGWKATASNVLRNFSEQLGARSQTWNQGVYRAVVNIHQRLGLDPSDPATTWREAAFAAPRNSNHEADAPNRWQLAILFAVAAWLLITRPRDVRVVYAAALVFAFVSFCAYLKWQPFFSRLLLPLFVLGAPLASICEEMNVVLQAALCLFLFSNARPALVENWVRPLKGERSVFRRPRDAQYFADMTQWANERSYREAAREIAGSGCRDIGLDTTNMHVEYPLQALVREVRPDARFVHVGVDNASARFPQPVATTPCAVVCMDCAGDGRRLARYPQYPERVVAGKFVVMKARSGTLER